MPETIKVVLDLRDQNMRVVTNRPDLEIRFAWIKDDESPQSPGTVSELTADKADTETAERVFYSIDNQKPMDVKAH